MRATWWIRKEKLAAASIAVVTVVGLAAGAASSAAASGSPARAGTKFTTRFTKQLTKGLTKQTERTGVVPNTVIAVLSGTSVTGKTLRRGSALLAPKTSSAAVNTALSRLGATSIQPLFANLPAATARALSSAARQRIGSGALDLGDIVVIHVTKGSAVTAARRLAATSGISFAEPDRYVQTMDTGGQVLTASKKSAELKSARLKAADVKAVTPGSAELPTNYGFASSLDSYLNAQGIDAGGAYATLQEKYGQIPGTGETITNISVGDLTDASMTDGEVNRFGPNTILQNGQRYLDLPTMRLIPAYVAEPDGSLNGTASVEGTGDPFLDEIGLDFSVMAPLPDADQRAGETGTGLADLLGIAPGANYRLVVPATPTFSEIAQAFVAAVTAQSPPDVITASLGFGTDGQGFPGRYLEDDPIMESVIAAIVQHYGIVVVDSANDGTRLFTPTAIGPDGGATPTNVAHGRGDATSIDDVQFSTTPSRVIDSGSIDAGATTTDDAIAIPPQDGGDVWRNPTYAETRTDGSANYASGWGQRVTLSAPGDNIPAFIHAGATADSVAVVLNGGTSASAPEIAAAAADVLQAARLTHREYGPAQVIKVLQETGHRVASPPQADQHLNVGPQVDLTDAINAVLRSGHVPLPATTSIVRLSVAHRVDISTTGAAFTEYTDPGVIDLADPSAGSARGMNGAGATGPVTFAADITGPRGNNYALQVGSKTFTSTSDFIRVTPAELLAAAGQPLESALSRTVTVTYQVRRGRHVLAQVSDTLSIGPYDGTSSVAPAPVVSRVVAAGQSVTVSYDLTGVSTVVDPDLVVSAVGHWNPLLGPIFNAAYSVPLSGRKGTVTLPASAFGAGGGIYGVGIEQNTHSGLYGNFAPVRVTGFPAGFAALDRPSAPLLATAGTAPGHMVAVSRANPRFTLKWNAGPQAAGAILEISAPSPTLFGSYNTFSNMNGTQRDNNGFDAGSVVYQKLPAAAGSRTFSAVALGLPTSLSYDVRILPMDASGAVAGQASPSSLLEADDGLAPNGDIIDNFAMAGANSVVSIVGPDGAKVMNYDPATGTYGAPIASDPPGGQFYVFGVDPSAHTVLIDNTSLASDGTRIDDVELYDTRTGAKVGTPDLSGYTLKGGVVDAARDRADLLAKDNSSGDDTVIAVSMLTGATGTVTDADDGTVRPGTLVNIAVDDATGEVYASVAAGALLCFGGGTTLSEVDPGTGTVTVTAGGTHCDTDLAVDSGSGNLLSVNYRSVSLNIPGTSSLVVMPETDPSSDTVYPLRTGAPVELAADPIHHLALVLYSAPPAPARFNAGPPDSNSMSEIDVVDTTTGKIVKTLEDFNSSSIYGYPFFATNPGIQLDPAHRTGYMFATGDDQVQQFSY